MAIGAYINLNLMEKEIKICQNYELLKKSPVDVELIFAKVNHIQYKIECIHQLFSVRNNERI